MAHLNRIHGALQRSIARRDVLISIACALLLMLFGLLALGELVSLAHAEQIPGELRAHGPLHRFYLEHPYLVWLGLGVLVGLTPTSTLLLIYSVYRRRAEVELRAGRQRFMDFADTAADWFWEADGELRYTYVSERHAEITGVSREQMIGQLGLACEVDGDARDSWEAFQHSIAQRLPFRGVHQAFARADGSLMHWSISGKPIYDSTSGEFIGYRGTGTDITESQQLSARLTYQASHDSLTGLINRREFEQRLERVLQSVHCDGSAHAMCYLDLDQFKIINDTCGHVAGDELLRQISSLLTGCVRRRDTVARLGGDEVGVLMEHCSPQQARRVADSLREAFADFRFVWEARSFTLGVSIGVVPIAADSGNMAGVLAAADAACYEAKEQGRNRVHIYAESDDRLLDRFGQMQWVQRIQVAIDEGRFELMRQPIVPLTREIADGPHFELLLRLHDEAGQRLVPPGAFLPAAERYGLMTRIDRWVCQAAFDWLASHAAQLPTRYICAINLSGASLCDNEFAHFLVDALQRSGLQPSNLCFEVTETTAIANLSHARGFIEALAGRGCRFALDDFGSGLSSFEYLKNLPVEYLKIDGMFVRDIARDPIDYAMVKSINDIGHVMGKKTIAEFVEDDEVLSCLREIGVDFVQGYAVGPPQRISSPEHE
jgi:diguanylate cyclase (GGDEF)-like protein/PAS domain S-box-containing protein